VGTAIAQDMKNGCIMAGIDLGPATESVVSYAAFFSAHTQMTVRLLYVIDYLLTPPAYMMTYIEDEKKPDEAELKKWQVVLEHMEITSGSSIMMGRLHESFVAAIAEFSPGLLVIGYQTHALRPSSSERLIRSLDMPMPVVRGDRAYGATPGSVQVRKVLCAVDFSENSTKALKKAVDYSRVFSADLQVVHVVPSHRLLERGDSMGREERDRFQGDSEAASGSALRAMLREAGVQSEGTIIHGDPADGICSAAEQGGFDLIVMGSRGLSYIKSVLVGSTTESVLKASACPVLIVH
jgi:nucleotide-binding universal stress UspA family protein